MSADLIVRVSSLEEQVGGMRESLAVLHNEQGHTQEALTRIEGQLGTLCGGTRSSWANAMREPQAILIIFAIIAGLFGSDTAILASRMLQSTHAGDTPASISVPAP